MFYLWLSVQLALISNTWSSHGPWYSRSSIESDASLISAENSTCLLVLTKIFRRQFGSMFNLLFLNYSVLPYWCLCFPQPYLFSPIHSSRHEFHPEKQTYPNSRCATIVNRVCSFVYQPLRPE